MNRKTKDYIRKLLELSIALQRLSFSDGMSYEKSKEIKDKHTEVYNKWLFYKNLEIEIDKIKRR